VLEDVRQWNGHVNKPTKVPSLSDELPLLDDLLDSRFRFLSLLRDRRLRLSRDLDKSKLRETRQFATASNKSRTDNRAWTKIQTLHPQGGKDSCERKLYFDGWTFLVSRHSD